MDRIYSISTIRKKVKEYGKKINAPTHYLRVRSSSDDFGTPYIEIDESGYNYVVSERGIEFKRKKTTDITKLLYWIFKDIVFEIANEYELNHRRPNEDNRRQLFSKTIELMEILDPKFAKWEKKEIKKILEENPYSDTT